MYLEYTGEVLLCRLKIFLVFPSWPLHSILITSLYTYHFTLPLLLTLHPLLKSIFHLLSYYVLIIYTQYAGLLLDCIKNTWLLISNGGAIFTNTLIITNNDFIITNGRPYTLSTLFLIIIIHQTARVNSLCLEIQDFIDFPPKQVNCNKNLTCYIVVNPVIDPVCNLLKIQFLLYSFSNTVSHIHQLRHVIH